jgi:Putative Actinobacterial Holin-X, holin superfamily III
VNAADQPPIGERSESAGGKEGAQSIATAIADVSERASQLVREEIELAKAEMNEKVGKLAKGAIVGVAAGAFFIVALFFVLVGCAWLLYYYLPIGNDYTYFYGFFAMAIILVVLGLLAGLIAAKVVKKGSPPVPSMAIHEARKIRESVGSARAQERAAPSAMSAAAWEPRELAVTPAAGDTPSSSDAPVQAGVED